MLIALHPVDYGVLAVYLAAMVAVGAYFSREQRTSKDFFLAGRAMGWFPVGLSIMATLLSALSYSGVPGASYYAGLKYLLMPAAVWLTVPVLSRCVLPLYHGLGIYSVYEYLELRFDATTRLVSSVVFVLWRLLWLGGVLYAPCKVLVVAAGLDVPVWLLIVVLGFVSTVYTFLGGMKAVIWTDVIQALVMVGGLFFIIGGAWWSLEGGPARVWEVAAGLGRTEIVETEFRWDSYWTVWGIVPHVTLSMLSFYVADQITAQRYLTARNLTEARRSFLLNCLSVSIMGPALAYAGVALLAYYHDHPQSLPPKWVVNVDGKTRQALTYGDRDRIAGGGGLLPGIQADQPLVGWNEPIEVANIHELVQQRRILKPNSKEPFDNADPLMDPADPERLDINKLAMRYPPKGGLSQGEVILNVKAQDELLPRFITAQLPWGVGGLVLAALFAASMSSMDSGLNSICTLLIIDYHRRFAVGRAWLARRAGKNVDQLSEEDELKLGRPLVLVIGIAATLFSLLVAQIDDIFSIMIAVVNTFGGPLMAVFLLGMLTRRCTAASALTSLVAGTLFTLWLTAANKYPALAWLWPLDQKINDIWPLIFGVAFTLVVGYGLAFAVGRGKSKKELRGLVMGLGRLGVREPEEASIAIDVPPPPRRRTDRWK